LARHGQTQWNKLSKIQGQLDSPLTKLGIEQAHNLGRSLCDNNIELIVSSPQLRALRTATIASEHLLCPVHEHRDLAERNFGDWQGKTYQDIEGNSDHKFLFNEVFFDVTEQAPPNGESGVASAQRFACALANIAKNNDQQHILVLCHGDVLRNFLTLMLDFKQPGQSYGNCGTYTIHYHHDSGEFFMASTSISMAKEQ